MENGVIGVLAPSGRTAVWGLRALETGAEQWLTLPSFEVDGTRLAPEIEGLTEIAAPRRLENGVMEYVLGGKYAASDDLRLELVLRLAPECPVVRFHYRLVATVDHAMTKGLGGDRLEYVGTSFADLPSAWEVRLSEFNEMVHSFVPTEELLPERLFENETSVMGPILAATDGYNACLLAYEHGSQAPDRFLEFRLAADRSVRLVAVKGNYADGRLVNASEAYESIWLQAALVEGDLEELAHAYRHFVLRYWSICPESRKPYIFYNSWAWQERNKWWNEKTFLASMHLERILAEIDVAAAMGIDVYVIDTGWYEKTGDWRVHQGRFPDGLKQVKAKLDGYGMKMGLWFEPNAAAVSSQIHGDHVDCLMSRNGTVYPPHPVWETEDSQRVCLVSRFWEAFAEELIRLNRELGVTYFKWDAIGQYGCDSERHDHGNASNAPLERADCYAFELGRAMMRVVERLSEACPDAIVDFDVTEGGRFVGLGFLGVGKYFLINNGPYYQNLNIPIPPTEWTNVYVYPGPARPRVCRTPLGFDRWIPSVLFLTHYLPDDPAESQVENLASLILGQNGFWGDLLTVSGEGVARIRRVLDLYKQVRGDITESFPVRMGQVGGSPEIHEKIAAGTGRGVVVLFAAAPGRYTYVTAHHVEARVWCSRSAEVTLDGRGRAQITVTLPQAGALIVFFGVDSDGVPLA